MICPACGQYFSGASCPICGWAPDEFQIIGYEAPDAKPDGDKDKASRAT